MGLIKDLLGSAMGAGQVNNGFNQPLVPSISRGQSRNSSSSARPLSPGPSYQSYSNGRADRHYQDGSYYNDNIYPPRPRGPPKQQYRQDERRYNAGNGDINSGSLAWTDPPPPYGAQLNVPSDYDRSISPRRYGDASSRLYDGQHGQAYYEDPGRSTCSSSLQQSRSMQAQGFRPFAVPQITGGDGQPFLRAYSDELRQYGIEERQFIQVVDSINKAIVPNPENVIFQKAANIAGFFVPGAGGIALMAGQLGVGAGAAFGHASLVAKTLSRSNLDLFIPAGLEICIGKSDNVDNVDQEAGVYARAPSQQYSSNPESRVAAYGARIARLSSIHPPLVNVGRSDPIAMLANGMSKRSAAKKAEDAAKDRAEGKKLKKKDDPDASIQWLIVRRASPQSMQKWQQMLQQSEASLQEERRQAAAQGSSGRY